MKNLRTEFDAEEIPESFLLERMRLERDILLTQSDWTQMPDSPLTETKQTEWKEYRQALRDFPDGWTPSDTANFPDQPS
jgi:hypothetical protein